MAKSKKAKVATFNPADVANIAKANPYIQRLIDDAHLRENVQKAIESSKSAYGRLGNGKTPAKTLLEDRKLQGDLREALEAVRDASLALSEAPKKKARKGRRMGRRLRGRSASASDLRLRAARSCAPRFWTHCSAPRRSSSTRRRQARHRLRRPRRSVPPSGCPTAILRPRAPIGRPRRLSARHRDPPTGGARD